MNSERTEGWILYLADIIKDVIDEFVDWECPHCDRGLDLPSLEDIQEWLKEEK